MFRANTTCDNRPRTVGAKCALTLIAIITLAAPAASQNLEKLNRLLQAGSSSEPSAKAFREGRDLIDNKKWAGAAERFGDFISKNPNDKNVAAALYWRAYALAKVGKTRDANEAIERLLSAFSGSSWRKDAETLRLQIANDPDFIDKELKDREDEELKIIALQSLLRSDPARAVPIAAEWLKAGSNRSKEAKIAAINLLGRHGGDLGAAIIAEAARNNQADTDLRRSAIYWVAQRGSVGDLIRMFDAEKDEDVKQALLGWIARREQPEAQAKLTQVAKSDPSVDVRRVAIYLVSRRAGDQAVPLLIQLYDSERNEDIKQTILHGLARRAQQDPAAMRKLEEVAKNDPSTDLKRTALHWVYQGASLEKLIQSYDAEKDRDARLAILHWIGQQSRGSAKDEKTSRVREAALQKLLAIAQSDPDDDVRRTAVSRLSLISGQEGASILIRLYDQEKNVDVKKSLLLYIARRDQPEAMNRIMDAAKNESDRELKEAAIHLLAQRGGDQAVDVLIQLYDSETVEDVKQNILSALGRRAQTPAPGDSPQKRALRKLMQVARSDASIDLRRQAVFWLGQSKDPEAAKMIEEILK